MTGFKKRQETIGKRKHAIEARIDENNTRLERAEGEMKDVQKSCSVPEVGYNVTPGLIYFRMHFKETNWFWS